MLVKRYRYVFFLPFFAFSASAATTYYWRGGTDANWSTAANWTTDSAGTAVASAYPKDGDTAIFDASSGSDTVKLDSGVADYSGSFKYAVVSYLTLETGFTGTVALEKPLCVRKTYTQNAGTFTCGEYKFRSGSPTTRNYGSDSKAGCYYLRGGTFNAPSSEFEYYSVSHQVEFEILADANNPNGITYNHNNGTFIMECSCGGGNLSFKVRDVVFNDFIVRASSGFTQSSSINNMAYTNTVLGSFTHTTSRFTADKGCFIVKGAELTFGGKCQGGNAFIKLDNDIDQTIHCASTGCYAPPIYIDKPATTKVTFDGGGECIVNTAGGSSTTCYRGFELMSGDVDMSAIATFGVYSYHSNCRVLPGTTIVWPNQVKFYGYLQGTMTIKDQTFENLYVASTDGRLNLGDNSTNTINGTLRVASGGMQNAKSYYILKGDYIVDATFNANHAAQNGGGNAWVIMNSAADQTIAITNSTVNSLIIDKPEGSKVTVLSNNGNLMLGHTGTGSYISGEDSFNMKGGVLDLNGGGMMFTNGCYSTVQWTGGDIRWGEGKGLATYIQNSGHQVNLGFDAAHALPLLACSCAGDGSSANVLVASQGLYVTNFVQNGPKFGGTVNILGDHRITAKSYTSPNPIVYRGATHATFTAEDGAKNPTGGSITVNKDGGELKLNSDLTGTYGIYVSGGRVNLNGHNLENTSTAQHLVVSDTGRIYQPATGGQAISPRLELNDGGGLVLETSADADREPALLGTGTNSGIWFNPVSGGVANNQNWIEIVGDSKRGDLRRIPIMETKGDFWINGVGTLGGNMPHWNYLGTDRAGRLKVSREDKFMYLDWRYRSGRMLFLR